MTEPGYEALRAQVLAELIACRDRVEPLVAQMADLVDQHVDLDVALEDRLRRIFAAEIGRCNVS